MYEDDKRDTGAHARIIGSFWVSCVLLIPCQKARRQNGFQEMKPFRLANAALSRKAARTPPPTRIYLAPSRRAGSHVQKVALAVVCRNGCWGAHSGALFSRGGLLAREACAARRVARPGIVACIKDETCMKHSQLCNTVYLCKLQGKARGL